MIVQIFVDLDDVCNRFTMHTLQYMGCTCSIKDSDFPDVGYDIAAAANLLHEYEDFTSADFWNRLDHGVWDNLPLRVDCYQLLSDCATVVGKKNVFICTKSLPHPRHYAGKMEWIYNHLPKWILGQIIISSQKETNARAGALLIDDSEENVDKFRETRNGNAILVPRPWNKLRAFDSKRWIDTELKQYVLERLT